MTSALLAAAQMAAHEERCPQCHNGAHCFAWVLLQRDLRAAIEREGGRVGPEIMAREARREA